MKLKEFNAENTIASRSGIAAVSVNTKSGTFDFNKIACEQIGLKAGDLVVLHQDESEKENWYMEKVAKKGFSLRAKSAQTGLVFNNSSLARSVFESVELDKTSGRIFIAGKPTEFEKRKLWGLLTASLRNGK